MLAREEVVVDVELEVVVEEIVGSWRGDAAKNASGPLPMPSSPCDHCALAVLLPRRTRSSSAGVVSRTM